MILSSMSWICCTVSFYKLAKLDCKLDELAKLYCKLDGLAKLSMSSISW